ncbi:Proteasome inhibitor PI31 subunit [Desmophyllum pertusum]|uniref:Proteasome inhibitor PI31 subunit n=1 Tax=Desmophyllum pertusum TaxID=174260 RepID=A0A9X0CCJ0_9CNID|nr:Proteasome inhibitor PI31 subunit [Desmophyllum pertusum]
MAEVKLKNLLRLYKLRSKFDAVILAVHACLVERGFRCINSGEERNAQQECDFGETLPPDWNSLDDVYALQYRKGNLSSVFIFKALKLGDKVMLYLMEEDESKMHHTDLDVDSYTSVSVDYSTVQGTQQIDSIFRRLDQLKTKIFRDVVDKFTSSTSRAGSHEERRDNRTDNQREQPSRLIDDDPLRIPPRRPPDFHGEWAPPMGPFGYGDGDRLPGHPGGSGGMLMDPFRPGGGMQAPQGVECLDHHPILDSCHGVQFHPGARFDPFGPVPPGGSRADSRSGRFAGPDPDHLPPPGYDGHVHVKNKKNI